MLTDNYFSDGFVSGGKSENFRVSAVSASRNYTGVLKTNDAGAGSRTGRAKISFWDELICAERKAEEKEYQSAE